MKHIVNRILIVYDKFLEKFQVSNPNANNKLYEHSTQRDELMKNNSTLSLPMVGRFVIYGDGLHLFGRTEPKLIEEKQKKGIKYTPTYQCTTAALELLNAIPVTPAPPDGVGNVVAKKGVYTAWSGRVANPYHLSKQLGASVQTNSTSSQKDKKAQK